MKKLFTVITALSLCMAMSATTFAAEPIRQENHDVNARRIDSELMPTVYSVDVAWGEMQFTYTKTGSMQWDASVHRYVDSTTSTWSAAGNTVSITNHSNGAIKATLSAELNSGFSGSFTENVFTLPTAEETAVEQAPSKNVEFTLTSGTPDSKSFEKIGTLTVTISD